MDPVGPEAASPQATRRRHVRLGAVAAAASTFIALLSHVAAGGSVPGAGAVVFALLVATAASVRLAAIRRSTVRLTASVVVSQFAFHGLFAPGGGAAPAMPPAPGRPHTAHHVDAASAMAGFDPGVVAHDHRGPGMWLLHAAAAVVTIAALRRGERLLASLAAVRVAAERLLALPPLPDEPQLPVAVPAPVPVPAPSVPALGLRARRAIPRRGPPMLRRTASPAIA